MESTRNELPLACRLSHQHMFPVTRHFWQHTQPLYIYIYIYIYIYRERERERERERFGKCSSPRSNNHAPYPLLATFFFVTMIPSSLLVLMRLLRPLVVRNVVFGKRHFLFRVSSSFWSELWWQTKIIKMSYCSMFHENIFIKN